MPRFTIWKRAGKIILWARSPVAPKNTNASAAARPSSLSPIITPPQHCRSRCGHESCTQFLVGVAPPPKSQLHPATQPAHRAIHLGRGSLSSHGPLARPDETGLSWLIALSAEEDLRSNRGKPGSKNSAKRCHIPRAHLGVDRLIIGADLTTGEGDAAAKPASSPHDVS